MTVSCMWCRGSYHLDRGGHVTSAVAQYTTSAGSCQKCTDNGYRAGAPSCWCSHDAIFQVAACLENGQCLQQQAVAATGRILTTRHTIKSQKTRDSDVVPSADGDHRHSWTAVQPEFSRNGPVLGQPLAQDLLYHPKSVNPFHQRPGSTMSDLKQP